MPARHLITVVTIVKATVMGLLVGATALAFVEQLLLVAVSATMTGAFGLVVAWYTSRENRRLHDRLDEQDRRLADIAEHTATNRRQSDPEPEETG